LSIREGLEGVLIASILLGTLRRLGRDDLARYIWLGLGAALLVSGGIAAALSVAGIEFEGVGEQLFEGITLLLAVAVLTGMLFWMREEAPRLGARLKADVGHAVESAGHAGEGAARRPRHYAGLTLCAVAFLAVVREGIELALLLAATALSSSILSTAVGAVLGLATAVVIGLLVFRGAVRLNFKRFFQITTVILVLFAAGMMALSVREFIDAGVIPGLINPVWNLNYVISNDSALGLFLKTLFGYDGSPALPQVVAYVAYLSVVGWALWGRRPPRPALAS
jgi:high-affinity iron transporter